MVLDPNNPRSLAYQLARIETHLAALPQQADDGRLSPPEQIATALATRFRTVEAAALDVEMFLGAEAALMRSPTSSPRPISLPTSERSALGGARVIYDIRQVTTYDYASRGRLCPLPRRRSTGRASVCMPPLRSSPRTIARREGQDFGNRMTWIEFDQPHDQLSVRVAAQIAVKA